MSSLFASSLNRFLKGQHVVSIDSSFVLLFRKYLDGRTFRSPSFLFLLLLGADSALNFIAQFRISPTKTRMEVHSRHRFVVVVPALTETPNPPTNGVARKA